MRKIVIVSAIGSMIVGYLLKKCEGNFGADMFFWIGLFVLMVTLLAVEKVNYPKYVKGHPLIWSNNVYYVYSSEDTDKDSTNPDQIVFVNSNGVFSDFGPEPYYFCKPGFEFYVLDRSGRLIFPGKES